jgi:pimeloyl-ACP methyl ester carboxylesterase
VPGRYRLRDYAADTAAFLRGAVGEPARLFGHSLGGEVAVMVAAHDPASARAVVVGDAPLWLERHPTEDRRHREMLVLWRELAASGRPVEEIAAALRAMPVAVPGAAPAQARAGDVYGEASPWFPLMAESLRRLDPDMLSAVLAGPRDMLAGYDGDALLPAIACPVLLLQADPAAGGALPDEQVARALRLLRHGAHVLLPGLGHELLGLHQDPLLGIVTRFLEAV